MRKGSQTPWAPTRPITETTRPEWPTLLLLLLTHLGWAAVLLAAPPPALAVALLVPVLVLHSSLQHEVVHGHPTRSRDLNEALVSLPLGLAIPYARFRDQHLAHHHDPNLTDPYDDPETNYVDPVLWVRMSPLARLARRANNTLLGRMAVGPLISIRSLYAEDWRARRAPAIRRAYTAHWLGCTLVLAAAWASPLPLWAYLAAAYLALSVLKIRTFLEHRAAHRPRERSVVVEDRGLLALLFLNNNFHAVHHARPGLAWYRLPAAYAAERAETLRRNGDYRYPSYWSVIREHLLRAKDPVPHPLWHSGNRTSARDDAAALLTGLLPEATPSETPSPAPARRR